MQTITISPTTTLQDLQEFFSAQFPFLKIEFFHKPHQAHEGSPKRDMIADRHTRIGALSTVAMDVQWKLDPLMTVMGLETFFEDKLHLHVQVFFKSSKLWLESIRTDDIGLLDLNANAQKRNEQVLNDTDIVDYHEQE